MGSVKPGGWDPKPRRRRGVKDVRHRRSPRLEALERRLLLSRWVASTTNLADVENGPMANLGQRMIGVYESFEGSGGQISQLNSLYPSFSFQETSFQGTSIPRILAEFKEATPNFNEFQTELENLGMQVTVSSPYYGVVDGWIPISQLPTVAESPDVLDGAPLKQPVLRYQGTANNEGDTAMYADVARQQYGVDGTGVTVGVLSDSVNQYQGGLSDSESTGNLPTNPPVDVLSDGSAGSTDEGRAMLEDIYDVAPGAHLAFATAEGGDLTFANNIRALASTARANIIVDDVGYSDEPFFQDGFISQAINDVTAQGVSYFSAAGNNGVGGYLSNFRSATGTVPGVGSGTFMNFDPTGGTLLQLPITVTAGPDVNLTFQFDQPYTTQQPAGSTAAVTSSLSIYALDANGTVVASGADNNVATQTPVQNLTLAPGSYTIAIQLKSGPAPGHIQFCNIGDSPNLVVSNQFGNQGGTYYPSSYGHSTAANTIGVGAVPWWAASPYLGQNPLESEPFSSSGPGLRTLDSSGNPISPQLALNPAVTAPDGVNTSFFIPGNIINTSNNPPFWPGEPSTSTNLSQNLPSFFGTSAACENAAAVAALMEQKVPSLTPAQVRAGLIASAETRPMNSQTQGTWDQVAGYGLIDAVAAIKAVTTVTVVNPNNIKRIFVGASQYVTDSTQPEGDRANPYPTITAALAAASAGDRLEILPGVYTESVTLPQLVSMESASVDSTDTKFVPGNALSTVIRAPATSSGTSSATVTAMSLSTYVDPTTGSVFQSEIAGLSISSPLVGDPALGTINPNSIGIFATNSSLLIDKDYFVDSGCGVLSITSGSSSQAPVIENDGFIGNIYGIALDDDGTSNPSTTTLILNNTVAYNSIGLLAINTTSTRSQQAYVANNIFWENHDQTNARGGLGIYSQTIDKLVLANNMFYGNGTSDASSSGAAVNIGNGFNPGLLGSTASSAASDQGNFVGYPAFINPIDSRPGSDGPGFFFSLANFGLTSSSAAINNALESAATRTDFLDNPENPEPTTLGFKILGYGPRDVGAFEYEPIASAITTPVGGSFRVVTTSLVPDGGSQANGAVDYVTSLPTSVTVSFSQPVNQATVQATDLVLYGTDVSSISLIRATSITWLDDHTAQFNLGGQLNPVGTLNVLLSSDAIRSMTGAPLVSYSDSVVIDLVSLPPSSTTTPAPSPSPITPPPAPAPTSPPKKGKHTGSHSHKPIATTVNHTKKKVALEGTHRPPAFPGKGKKG